jgi:hypothetical protein
MISQDLKRFPFWCVASTAIVAEVECSYSPAERSPHGGSSPDLAPTRMAGLFCRATTGDLRASGNYLRPSRESNGTKTRSRTFSEAMTVNAARYRTYFEDARKRAEQVSDPVEKQAWLRMAEKWFKLLALAEQHAPKEA